MRTNGLSLLLLTFDFRTLLLYAYHLVERASAGFPADVCAFSVGVRKTVRLKLAATFEPIRCPYVSWFHETWGYGHVPWNNETFKVVQFCTTSDGTIGR
jgi:hypothetical protein